MKPEDLWKVCPVCHGERKLYKTEEKRPHSTVLETAPCDKCKSLGIVVTQEGEVLWKFFKKLKELGAL